MISAHDYLSKVLPHGICVRCGTTRKDCDSSIQAGSDRCCMYHDHVFKVADEPKGLDKRKMVSDLTELIADAKTAPSANKEFALGKVLVEAYTNILRSIEDGDFDLKQSIG